MTTPVASRHGKRTGTTIPRAPRRRNTSRERGAPPPTPQEGPPAKSNSALVFAAVLLMGGIWSYLPTFLNLVETWSRVVDYSHGFFVIPLALYFLWVRRDKYPGLNESSPNLALLLLSASLALRHVGDAFYFTFLDGWSLVPWAASVCAVLGGRPLLRWCWPSLVFLLFMVPLPFSLENNLSGPLQRIATLLSTQTLQFLGQPGFAEGNVIVLGDQRLEVAQACSGLRLFVGIVALTYAYVVVLRRPLWEKAALIAAAPLIAIVSNAARIVVTGLLYRQLLPGPAAAAWIHDGAGWAMIALAAVLFWLWLRYLKLLVQEEEVMDMMAVVRQCRV